MSAVRRASDEARITNDEAPMSVSNFGATRAIDFFGTQRLMLEGYG
jgi:hypothetical protein